MSFSVRSFVGIGGLNATVTVVGLKLKFETGHATAELVITTGTIARFVFTAILKPPRLNGPIAPVLLRVPSGKIAIFRHSLINEIALRILSVDIWALLRLIKIISIFLSIYPVKGLVRNSALAIKCNFN